MSDYEDTTHAIDTIVSTQLSSVLQWINVPGTMTKVSSSAAGFVWGYSGTTIYSCQLPCTGNWQASDVSAYSIQQILDIATDPTYVYVLYIANTKPSLLVTPANRQGVWATIDVPFGATQLFSTHTYLWAQDGTQKQMCPKPCVMANWLPVKENVIKITSATDTTLYGVDPTGQAVQTDETMRSGWAPMTQFGKVTAVIGSDTNTYAITPTQTLVNDQPLATSGYTPQTLTTGSNQLWMTSTTPGQLGNVFTRIETPDYAGITNTLAPLDTQRDALVSNLESEFAKQTDVMTVRKQVDDVIQFFKQIFHLDRTTASKSTAQAGHLQEQIRSTQTKLDQMRTTIPVLQIAILALVGMTLIYLLFSGWIAHILAMIVMVGGVFFLLVFHNG